MSTVKDSKQILLNSQYATKYNNGSLLSNVYFSFPSLLVDESNVLYKQISISNCQIPVSFYTINEYNDKLYYKIGAGATQTLSFVHGNYNATSFITQFIAQMGAGWNATINRNTGVMSFTYTTNFTFLASSTLYQVMGFSNQNFTSTSNTLTADNLADFSGVRSIAVRSSTLSLTNRDCKSNSYSQNIQVVPVNQPAYGIIKFENVANFTCILNNTHLDGFDIILCDDKGNYIDMNNCHWNMTIQLDVIRRTDLHSASTYNIVSKIDDVISLLSSIVPQSEQQPEEQGVDQPQEESIDNAEANQAMIENFNPENSLDMLLYSGQL